MNPGPTGERDRPAIRQLIIGGGSHASKLAEAIGHSYPDVLDLSLCGWQLSERSADDLASDIADAIPKDDQSGVVVVLELFDSTIYKGSVKGNRANHTPFRIDGTYHVEGALGV